MDINTPYTDIGDATAGQTVKLFGAIDSPGKVAFVLEYRDDAWRLIRSSKVSVIDKNNDSIRLDLSKCHDFYPESHNLSRTFFREYWDEDRVTVFGTVSQDDSGVKTLEVRRLYPRTMDPYETMQDWYKDLWKIPVFLVFPFSLVILAYWNRGRLHRCYIAGHPVNEKWHQPRNFDGQAIDWKPNPRLPRDRTKARLFIAASVALATMLTAVSLIAPWNWEDYPWPMLLSSVALFFTIGFGYFFFNERFIAPESVGFSKAGIHLRYHPNKRSPTRTYMIPWTTITKTDLLPDIRQVQYSILTDERVETILLPKELAYEIGERATRASPALAVAGDK